MLKVDKTAQQTHLVEVHLVLNKEKFTKNLSEIRKNTEPISLFRL